MTDTEKELVEKMLRAYWGAWHPQRGVDEELGRMMYRSLIAARPIIETQAVEKMFRDFLVWNKGKIPHDIGTVNYLNRFIRVYAKERHNIDLTDPKNGEK